MSTALNDEEAMLVQTVRAFIDREVKPTVRDVEHANTYPEAWIEQMKRIGIFGLAISEEYGGSPVSMPCYVDVTQELARGWMSLAGAMGGHTVVAKLLEIFGTGEQKRAYLPAMATGELRATMALTEPGGGSDLQAMTTVARRDGDKWVIDGAKTWISNARRSGLIALLSLFPKLLMGPISAAIDPEFAATLVWQGQSLETIYGLWNPVPAMLIALAGAALLAILWWWVGRRRGGDWTPRAALLVAPPLPPALMPPLAIRLWQGVGAGTERLADLVRAAYTGNGQTYVLLALLYFLGIALMLATVAA